MTPDEALKILDSVISVYRGTREEHKTLAQALLTIQSALKPAEKPEPKE